MTAAFTELYEHRELLRNFFSRDLRARYKGSALGIVWSLLNPLVMLLVYTLAFSVVMKARVPGGNYPVFFMAAFLPWTFFASSVQMGATTLIAHSGLIQKVYFPREVLPLSITGANVVNMGIAFAVFLPFAFVTRGVSVLGLVLLVPITAALFLFAAGLAMLLSVLTVYFRDIDFLLGLVMTAWFFLTPIVFARQSIPDRYQILFDLNPMTAFTDAYRQALYHLEAPDPGTFALCVTLGVGVFLLSYLAFNRLKANVAEEL